MKLKKSAKDLSKALYSVSKEHNLEDEVYLFLVDFTSLVTSENQFRALLQSKKIAGADKIKILKEVFGDKANILVLELTSYLSGLDAVHVLKEIKANFERFYKKDKNIVTVKGIVSKELDQKQIAHLKSSLDSLLGKKTDLSIVVDKTIIGGIKLRIENTFLDGSVLNQLQSLRTELLQI